MDSFNLRLKALRKEKGKTQQNIADLLKVRRSTYGEYERGKILPPMDKIKILADYFGVSVDYFVSGTNEPETEVNSIDVSENLKTALNYLKENQHQMIFDGEPLDNESRELLIQSLENGLKMAHIIKKGRKNND